jgi:very-short-patch-repair endonuclease
MPVQCICQVCGKTFKRSPSGVGPYCSYVCMGKGQSAPRQEWTCERCGKPFPSPPGYGRRRLRYCSLSCASRHPKARKPLPACEICGNLARRRGYRYCTACRRNVLAELMAERIRSGELVAPRLTQDTKPERILIAFLTFAGFTVQPQRRFGHAVIDAYLPEHHLAFEADGDYWHARPDITTRDLARDARLLKRFNLPVVRLWQSELISIHRTLRLHLRTQECSGENSKCPTGAPLGARHQLRLM